ncbi:hypothetical protein DES49_1853 [Halospina denitrificans]|uniref:Contractile injection system tube protein N-terminal domain-containing protein n=1 Tax=Halospina denitrificans TaxID=332522 RepID=A0A4R7JTU2_9GAMM|nr:hypothetical protein [Halospina denitrificans]TDT41751.1 hypothetical protein DES49_1853 [Halospina denitrificans]
MEKAVLLIEHSGDHLRCLLNPEQLEFRRSAGIGSRQSLGGALTGEGLSDDPLLYRGGGQTEFTLDLLFDTSVVPQSQDATPVADVRQLTGPLWELAENSGPGDRHGRPPTVAFLWGTRWNQRGVVAAVSERLEHFTRDGNPRRSWLRLRLLRVGLEEHPEPEEPSAPPVNEDEARRRLARGDMVNREPVGDSRGGERLDQIAAEHFGHAGYWTLLADINGLDDPFNHDGRPLRVPADPGVIGGGGS